MADDNLISPVSGNRPVPRNRRPVPASQDQKKRQPERQPAEKKPQREDDDRPGIDEYA